MQFSCVTCNKFFITDLALRGHQRMHGSSGGKIPKPRCCCLITKREIEAGSLEQFQKNIKYCKQCSTPLDSYRKFCNRSCAARFNNIDRIINGYTVTEKHRKKTSESLIMKSENAITTPASYRTKKIIHQNNVNCNKSPSKKKMKLLPEGEFSQIFICKCPHCKIPFCTRQKTKYCNICAPLYGLDSRSRYKFVFNVYHYPDLFDLQKIKDVGWYSRGGTAGEWNPDGLSRDHRVSVTDSIRNNYDPYYIKHPINCEIIPWIENNKKKGKSSITYTELVLLVDAYDSTNKK